MIELSTNSAFMIYLGMTLGIVLFVWVYQHYKFREYKMNTSEQELYVCEFCHFAYMEEINKKVTKCPQCTSFNKNNPYRC